jgi:elongation factor Ts
MHVAAMNPEFYTRDEMNQDDLDRIKAEILEDIKKDESMASKPENVLDGIATGRLNKKLSDIVLLDQVFVKATGKETVAKYLDSKNAKLVSVVRFEVGEGIEVEETDFAAEVAAQMAAK